MPIWTDEHSPMMQRCARHPNVETGLTCVTCGTPICPDCMVETPGGMKCRSCGIAPLPAIYRVGPGALAIAVTVAAATWLDEGRPWAVFAVEEIVWNVEVTDAIRRRGP